MTRSANSFKTQLNGFTFIDNGQDFGYLFFIHFNKVKLWPKIEHAVSEGTYSL